MHGHDHTQSIWTYDFSNDVAVTEAQLAAYLERVDPPKVNERLFRASQRLFRASQRLFRASQCLSRHTVGPDHA
jgi:hypothetical protein